MLGVSLFFSKGNLFIFSGLHCEKFEITFDVIGSEIKILSTLSTLPVYEKVNLSRNL